MVRELPVVPLDGISSAPRHQAGRWQVSALTALACVLGVRLFLTVYLAAAALMFPQKDLREQYAGVGVELLDSGWEGALLGVWQREDALWYQKIAMVGYSITDMTAEFFPLFSVLMRLVTFASGVHPVLAAIGISDVSLFVALLLLHRLLAPVFGLGVANRTLVYLVLFPSAFFLHGPFTESLMLALVMLSLFLVSRGRWVEAAFIAYLGGLARPQGVLLGIPLALYLVARGKTLHDLRSVRLSSRDLMPATLLGAAPLLGVATFLAFVNTAWRSPGTYSGIGPGHGIPALPGAAMAYAVQNFATGTVYPIEVFNFALAVAALSLTAVCLARLEVAFGAYALLFLLPPLSRYLPLFPLMSFNRYVLLLFPCFVVLAMFGRRRWVHLAIITLWLSGLLFWSAKFYTGYFVG